MSDFRIDSLNGSNYVIDYNTYIVTDKSGQNPLQYARKFNIDNLSENSQFYSFYGNYVNDFEFYINKVSSYSSKLFNIDNSKNYNIEFVKEGVTFTPYGKRYNLSSNSQSDEYGYYFDIERNVEGLDVSYIIEPQIYSKEYIDYIIGTCNFELTGDAIIDVEKSGNDYVIKNLLLFTNKSNGIFNPFYDGIYTITHSKNVLDIKRRYWDAQVGSSIFSISNSNELCGNSLVINDTNARRNNNGGNGIYIVGKGENDYIFDDLSTILIDDFKKSREFDSVLNLIISSGINFEKHEVDSELYIGDDNLYSLSINGINDDYKFYHITNYEDSIYSYGLYIHNGKIIVGSINDKVNDEDGSIYARKTQNLAFGGYCPDYAGTFKFVICGEDYMDDFIFVVMQEGVYYNRINLLDNLDDDYVYSSYWDLVINADKLKSDVLYTY